MNMTKIYEVVDNKTNEVILILNSSIRVRVSTVVD